MRDDNGHAVSNVRASLLLKILKANEGSASPVEPAEVVLADPARLEDVAA